MRAIALVVASLVVTAEASAQVAQPADSARAHDQSAEAGEPSRASEPAYASQVHASRPVREEDLVGDYAQPRWTARRRFPTTRVYVVPSGVAQAEWWLDTKIDLNAPKDARFRSMWELELGLGHRLQLDLYLATQQQGVGGELRLHRELVEVRWALADWGKLPGNPTLYFELARQHDAPPLGEVKLLLGGELAERWHWGANLVLERELGGEDGHEYAVTGAVSYTVLDERFSAGLELRGEATDVAGARFDLASVELLAGPSLQWRPIPAAFVDLVALFGAEHEGDETAPIAQPLLVAGWTF